MSSKSLITRNPKTLRGRPNVRTILRSSQDVLRIPSTQARVGVNADFFVAADAFTCDVDSLLELVLLTLLEWSVDDVCRRYSTSLKTFLSPPPGRCLMLASEPTLLSTLSSIFWSTICRDVTVAGERENKQTK